MTLTVSAGLPGKILVVADGVEVQLDQGLGLYDGLHQLAAALEVSAIDAVAVETLPAPPAAPAPVSVIVPPPAPTVPAVDDEVEK